MWVEYDHIYMVVTLVYVNCARDFRNYTCYVRIEHRSMCTDSMASLVIQLQNKTQFSCQHFRETFVYFISHQLATASQLEMVNGFAINVVRQS